MRYKLGKAICDRRNIPYSVVYRSFPDIEAAKAWMDLNQLGRRNLSNEDRNALIKRLAEAGYKQKVLAEAWDLTTRQIRRIVKEDIMSSPPSSTKPDQTATAQLKDQLAAAERRIKELEARQAPAAVEVAKTPSQIAREGQELQRIEAERARKRMEAGKKTDPSLNSNEGNTLDAVAASLGISRDRWYKIRTVFQKARSGDAEARELMKAPARENTGHQGRQLPAQCGISPWGAGAQPSANLPKVKSANWHVYQGLNSALDPAAFQEANLPLDPGNLSLEGMRRHLDEAQRAMCAARIANMRRGRPAEKEANWPVYSKVTLDTAAKQFNVSERSIKRARKIQSTAAPELIEAVDDDRAGAVLPLEGMRSLPGGHEISPGRGYPPW